MFSKVSTKKIKCNLMYKYFFQLVINPVLYGVVLASILFTILCIRDGAETTIGDFFGRSEDSLFGIHNASLAIVVLSYIINIVNILSIIPFIGLIEDLFTKNDVIEKEITFASVFPMFEISSYFGPHRFLCDTFSRKDNSEVFVIDENKKYYRLLWNENYGSKVEFEKFEKAEKLKIQYLKHSRIIVGVEVLD